MAGSTSFFFVRVLLDGDSFIFLIAVGRVLLECYRRFRKGSVPIYLASSKLETRIHSLEIKGVVRDHAGRRMILLVLFVASLPYTSIHTRRRLVVPTLALFVVGIPGS